MKTFSSQAGFTLIEVLVASSILMLVSGAVIASGRLAVRAQVTATARTQAYQLVQEDLEIVRQMRDSNILDNSGGARAWNQDFPEVGSSPESPIWNAAQSRWQLVASNGSGPTIQNGEETIVLDGQTFYRSVTFSAPSLNYDTIAPLISDQTSTSLSGGIGSNSVVVTVTVRWLDGVATRKVQGTSMLTNWGVS